MYEETYIIGIKYKYFHMKASLFFFYFLFLLPTFCFGQQVYYVDQNGKKVESMKDAKYCLKMYFDSHNSDKGYIQVLTTKGDSVFEHRLSSFRDNRRDGKQKSWFENGKIKYIENYENGILHGEIITFWSNGKIKRKDYFKYGTFVRGDCFDSTGVKVPHFDYVILPQYPEGVDACASFIAAHLNYPADARKNGIEGKVLLSFVVDEKGNIDNIQIIKSIHPSLDQEAIRVVKTMKGWNPGKRDGEPMRASFTLPVNFKLSPNKIK